MYPAYQISKLNERRALTSPQMRFDVTRLELAQTGKSVSVDWGNSNDVGFQLNPIVTN